MNKFYIKGLIVCLFATYVPLNQAINFDKVVLWGHKQSHNTFFYVHNALERTFKHLGYQVYWLDNNDNISNLNLSNALFFTEGQVDQKIPVREDCWYVLHNCDMSKYNHLREKGQAIIWQVYTHDVLPRAVIKHEPFIYYSVPDRIIYMPWATDLLPYEIDEIKKTVSLSKQGYVPFIGTIQDHEPLKFKAECEKNGIPFHIYRGKSIDENINLVKNAYMAPTVVIRWQQEKGYIPCRAFKNISYGAMCITNSPTVYELFDKKVIYHPDPHQLFYVARERLKTVTLEEIHDLMDFVKTKHTFLNRIDMVLFLFNKIEESKR